VTAHTHDAPVGWKGRAHDASVRDEFSQRYQLRVLLALRELLSLLLAPLLLAWHVPLLADDLVSFVDRHTASVEGVGTVCQHALFNAKGVGDGGKLAKSMISFQAHHPTWRPPPASKVLSLSSSSTTTPISQ
jgi:autophagy-related protein 9